MSIRNFIFFFSRRILQAIPLLLVMILINFLIIHAAPGDPVTMMVGPNPVSEEFIAQIRQDLGLDRPLHVQLGAYILHAVQGDLGISYAYRKPVIEVVLSRLLPTLLLMGSAYTLSAIIGILLGIISARRPGSLIDNGSSIIALIGYSVPAFWTAFIVILLFSVTLGWFPVGGMVDVRSSATGLNRALDILHHMVLPTLVLTFFFMALVTRLTRGSMLEVLGSDFIVQARAKGLPERRVIFKHALPNALLPVITVMGLQFGYMLAGAVLTETVFAWPGLGRLVVEAVGRRDYPLLMGIFIISAMLMIFANIITDIIYVFIDPRIRISGLSTE